MMSKKLSLCNCFVEIFLEDLTDFCVQNESHLPRDEHQLYKIKDFFGAWGRNAIIAFLEVFHPGTSTIKVMRQSMKP